MSFTKILVAIDFSSCSRKALERAIGLARDLGAEITVLHAVAPVSYDPLDRSIFGKDRPKYTLDDYLNDAARRDMKKFIATFPNIDERHVELRPGEPVQVVLETIEDGGYDLVVLGTHGRTNFEHFMMGSVAERVVRVAPCAVLTVREPREEAEDD